MICVVAWLDSPLLLINTGIMHGSDQLQELFASCSLCYAAMPDPWKVSHRLAFEVVQVDNGHAQAGMNLVMIVLLQLFIGAAPRQFLYLLTEVPSNVHDCFQDVRHITA